MKKELKSLLMVGSVAFGLVFDVSSQSLDRYEVPASPYDSYMGAFKTVAARGSADRQITIDEVSHWTEEASSIRYEHLSAYEWKSPAEVDATGTGDCKDKALWLYAKLTEAGARDLEIVVGKKNSRSNEYHAWLYLTLGGRSYLLDPTYSGSVADLSEFRDDEYLPAYSYTASKVFAYRSAASSVAGVNDPRYLPVASMQ